MSRARPRWHGWPARPKQLIGRGWPQLGAACSSLGHPLAPVKPARRHSDRTSVGPVLGRAFLYLSIYLSRVQHAHLLACYRLLQAHRAHATSSATSISISSTSSASAPAAVSIGRQEGE